MAKQCCKDTWSKIPDDEPVFILRAKDLLAAQIVDAWVRSARAVDVPADKIERAKQHYADFLDFRNNYPERCKIPD